jgi:hypothetical protein
MPSKESFSRVCNGEFLAVHDGFFCRCGAETKFPLTMGYTVKVQKVERPTNRSFYINLPAALADAIQLSKGEELEWFIEDKNTLILRRKKPAKALKLKH